MTEEEIIEKQKSNFTTQYLGDYFFLSKDGLIFHVCEERRRRGKFGGMIVHNFRCEDCSYKMPPLVILNCAFNRSNGENNVDQDSP